MVADMVNDGSYHLVVMLFTIGLSSEAVRVFPARSFIEPLTFIVIRHVTVSPLEGVLPSWLIDIGRVNDVDPVLDKEECELEYPPVPDADMVIVSVFQSTSFPDAVHETVTLIPVTSFEPT